MSEKTRKMPDLADLEISMEPEKTKSKKHMSDAMFDKFTLLMERRKMLDNYDDLKELEELEGLEPMTDMQFERLEMFIRFAELQMALDALKKEDGMKVLEARKQELIKKIEEFY